MSPTGAQNENKNLLNYKEKNMSSITRYNRVPSLLGRSVVEDLFTSLFSEPETLVKRSTEGYPVSDIFTDDKGNSVIECALAGFSKEQLSIEAKDGRITIIADGGTDVDDGRRIARRSFNRTYVDHSGKLDLSNAQASFENGLLRVTVPPTPEASATTITIS